MRVLFVHPSPLMYSEIYLRLEPLGLELVAESVRRAGHEVKLLDLQIFSHRDYFLLIEERKPHAIGFSLNYLANIPEVVDLAKHTKARTPDCFIFVGGHSASDRVAQFHHARLPPVRCTTRCSAYKAAARSILQTTRRDPAGPQPETPWVQRPEGHVLLSSEIPGSRANQFREDALEILKRL